MATATNIVIPDNKEIVQRASTTDCRQFRVSTGTNVKNGYCVIGGPTDGDCVTCTDENSSALGFVVRDETLAAYRETDRTTDYTAGDIVAVAHGPGTQVVAYSEGAVTIGNKMVTGTNGAIKAWSSDNADLIIARAEQTLTAAGWLVVTLEI